MLARGLLSLDLDAEVDMWLHLTAKLRHRIVDLADDSHGRWLWEHLRRAFPGALAAVLMPNHVHLVIDGDAGGDADGDGARDPIDALRRVLASFASVHGLGRRIWEPIPVPEPVYSTAILRRKIRYVLLNPCRGSWRLCADPLEWQWSTHRDVMGAVFEPWISAARLADVVSPRSHDYLEPEERLDEFRRWFHRYVTVPLTVHGEGTAPPSAAPSRGSPDVPLAWIAQAALVATRSPPEAIARRGIARRAFVLLGHQQGWRKSAHLADYCGLGRHAVRLVLARPEPALLQAAALCLGDSRLTPSPHGVRSHQSGELRSRDRAHWR